MSYINSARWSIAEGLAQRSLIDRIGEVIEVRNYAYGVFPVGTGSTLLLSTLFASLAAAQVYFPLATSLTQEHDEVVIQQAISVAYANRISRVEVGFGNFLTTGPIYQDHDNNLSVDPANPTYFSFSLDVRGQGSVNGDGWGTRITPATNDYVCWWIGPGQGNKLSGLNIMGPYQLTRADLPATGAGIAVAGGNGGASRTTVERCWVQYLYNGISVGLNSDALGDSNMFIDCNAISCYTGYRINNTQNYINTLVHCNAGNCKYGVWSAVGKAVHIFGGNLSAHQLNSGKFTIGSVSALTTTDHLNITFTATVTSPDAYFASGDYDIFCVKTEFFGLVPLVKTNWNSGTSVITLKIDPNWIDASYGYQNTITSTTEIATDIQARTTLYCAERAISALGSGIHIHGVHLENPVSVTAFLISGAGFDGDTICTVDNIYTNYSPSGVQWKDDATYNQVYYLQQCWPFIEAESVPITMRACNFADAADGFLIRASAAKLFRMEDAGKLGSPKIQVYGNNGDFIDSNILQTRGMGLGKWSTNPYIAPAEVTAGGANGINKNWKTNSLGQAEYWGFFPAPGSHPVLTPAQVAALDTTPGTIGQYPAICGGIAYRVMDFDTPLDGSGKLYAMSGHKGISYGQDLPINYTYKGQSNCLYMDDVSKMFPGLVISPDNTNWYVVTGVYDDNLLYVTVVKWANDQDPQLVGTKTTTYTGSTIYQQDYNVVRF